MKTILSDIPQRNFNGQNLPLFFYSYSSKGFPDIVNLVRDSLQYIPMYLLSLYDFDNVLSKELITPEDSRIRIWDSGGYEMLVNSSSYISSSLKKWDASSYINTANTIPWNGNDILASYDTPNESISIQDQIERAIDLYSQIEGTYFRNLLIHIPYDTNPHVLLEKLEPYVNEFHILGVTEKEIAPTWVHGVHFIKQLRSVLSAIQTERYIPIHVFGCLDQKTLIRFALAGADFFDGLTWLRYFFSNGEVLYKQEYQYAIPIKQSLHIDLKSSMMRHNITEMEKLRSHLVFAINTNNYEKFQIELSDINVLLNNVD